MHFCFDLLSLFISTMFSCVHHVSFCLFLLAGADRSKKGRYERISSGSPIQFLDLSSYYLTSLLRKLAEVIHL